MSAVDAGDAAGSWRVHRCTRCGESFRRRSHLVLHTGRRHGGDMDPHEVAAFQEALGVEEEQLARLRVHVKAAFAVLPIFLFTVFVIILIVETGTNPGVLIVGLPGVVVFGLLVYAMVLSRAEYERVEAAKRAAVGADEPGHGDGLEDGAGAEDH